MTPEQRDLEARAAVSVTALSAVAFIVFFAMWVRGGSVLLLVACVFTCLSMAIHGFRAARLRGWLGR